MRTLALNEAQWVSGGQMREDQTYYDDDEVLNVVAWGYPEDGSSGALRLWAMNKPWYYYGGGAGSGGGGGGGGEAIEEVVVEAQKILSDNLKVDLGKCGIPIDLLLNPHDKIDSANYWKSCFETLTPEDLKNLADAFKELSKLISDRKLATAVSGNWIKQCIIAIESGNGGWFGQNYFDLLGSAALGGLVGQALKTITKR